MFVFVHFLFVSSDRIQLFWHCNYVDDSKLTVIWVYVRKGKRSIEESMFF